MKEYVDERFPGQVSSFISGKNKLVYSDSITKCYKSVFAFSMIFSHQIQNFTIF